GRAGVGASAATSWLCARVSRGEMPRGKVRLTDGELRTTRDWINGGAWGTGGGEGVASRAEADKKAAHWAFRLPTRPAVPPVRAAERVHNPVDAFLLARLEAKGLTYSADADRVTLVRRAYLGLCGLPPAPEEVDAFLADGRPDAFDRLVDRLLASRHFGERWGRHWLDVVGYADTVGFDGDANNIILSDGKWRYRDYVIDAFNKDK